MLARAGAGLRSSRRVDGREGGQKRASTAAAVARIGVAASLVIGCGPGDGDAPEPAVRDSAGVTIVENPEVGGRGDGEAWRLSAEPIVEIGMVEGPPEYQLFRVVGAVRLSDGRIAVADRGTSEVRFYDADGRFLSASGGEGEGPGEYRRIGSLIATPGDSLLIDDWQLGRLALLDPEGGFVRAVRLETDAAIQPRVLAALDERRLLARQRILLTSDDVEPGLQRRSSLYLTYGMDGALRDTVGEFPGSDSYLQMVGGGGFAVTSPPFGRRSAVVAGGGRVFAGTSDRFDISVYGLDGTLRRRVRAAHTPVPVTSADIDAFRDERLAEVDDDDARRRIERALAEMPSPEAMPAFEDFVVDATGHLWVEAFRPPGGDERPRWSVFDPEGRWVGVVETPPRFELYEIGEDYVLGRFTDELDVQRVRLYRLDKPTGGGR